MRGIGAIQGFDKYTYRKFRLHFTELRRHLGMRFSAKNILDPKIERTDGSDAKLPLLHPTAKGVRLGWAELRFLSRHSVQVAEFQFILNPIELLGLSPHRKTRNFS
jgi:hypothetical protein